MNVDLYHFWSEPRAQRVRLALAFKKIVYRDHPLDYWDDETIMQLGCARQTPILKVEEQLYTHSEDILWNVDDRFPNTPKLVDSQIDKPAWDAVLSWRGDIEDPLARLTALASLSYRDIAQDSATIENFKAHAKHRFGVTLEEIANGRYDLFQYVQNRSRLKDLATHLAKNRFYTGKISIADMLLTADLYPLQVIDGIALPIDLLYYFQRIEETCDLSLKPGLVFSL